LDKMMMYSGTYEDIIQTLASWIILDLTTLLKKVDYNYSHQAFAKRVKKLEDFGYLASVYFQNYRKYLFLTEKGLAEAGLNNAWGVNKEIIHHDIITVNVFQYLLKLPQVKEGRIYLDLAGADRRPDCALTMQPNFWEGKELAIEVEITQKSYDRVENKFRDYMNKDSPYSKVLYIIQKTPVFEAYKRSIERVDFHVDAMKNRRCQDNIILLLAPEIKNRQFDLMDSPAFFEGRITTLRSIFHQ